MLHLLPVQTQTCQSQFKLSVLDVQNQLMQSSKIFYRSVAVLDYIRLPWSVDRKSDWDVTFLLISVSSFTSCDYNSWRETAEAAQRTEQLRQKDSFKTWLALFKVSGSAAHQLRVLMSRQHLWDHTAKAPRYELLESYYVPSCAALWEKVQGFLSLEWCVWGWKQQSSNLSSDR